MIQNWKTPTFCYAAVRSVRLDSRTARYLIHITCRKRTFK